MEVLAMMGWYGGWGNGWTGILMGLPMLVFWGLIIIGFVYLVKSFSTGSSEKNNDKIPLDLLKERYAKGEINESDFDHMKNKL
jgi:putative membrane protein